MDDGGYWKKPVRRSLTSNGLMQRDKNCENVPSAIDVKSGMDCKSNY